ncbi:MAG: hypothetical protein WCY74_04575 [Sphaerochaetaceae bacterium]
MLLLRPFMCYSLSRKGRVSLMERMMQSAGRFIHRNARPLDLVRWQFHFEGGSADSVLKVLACYQNADGGFGSALEADIWNPESSPMQTWSATEIIRELGITDADHPILQGILCYLGSGRSFDGRLWYKVIKSNNAHPHAPWWETEEDTTDSDDYNPSATLAGFFIRWAFPENPFYPVACQIARNAYAQLCSGERENGMHTIFGYLRLHEDLLASNRPDIIDLNNLEALLREEISRQIEWDPKAWEHEYVCRPSQFVISRGSPFCHGIEDIIQEECAFLRRTQSEDGSWPIPWNWSAYQQEWAIAKNWWKSDRIIHNLRFIRAMGTP